MTRLDTGPPNGNGARQGADPKTENPLRSYRTHKLSASFRYLSLLANRYAHGLLAAFHCSSCGGIALDPCGRNNKGEWLCGRCV
jgi:hypothetical protein